MAKTYNKPNWVAEGDLVATKSGWCYAPNHNEVLVAVGYLDTKLADQEVPEVPEVDVPAEPEPEPEPETPPEGEPTP